MAANDPLVKSVSPGEANDSISGTQFNGLTQATAYGDDFQNATNHPRVRIVHTNGGHIFCGKTHTQFDLPDDIELGPSNWYVVANGIQSARQRICVHWNARTRPSPRKIQTTLRSSIQTKTDDHPLEPWSACGDCTSVFRLASTSAAARSPERIAPSI